MEGEKPHYHGHRERLRKRFLKNGLQALADHEVVEPLLTLVMPRRYANKHDATLLAMSLQGVLPSVLLGVETGEDMTDAKQ